ncbi:MAG: CHAT domain-containing protein [Synechococcales bacterium]|nr:CHAT domain-containing protein [Synechococcales bacterium]
MRFKRRWQRGRQLLLGILTAIFCVTASPAIAHRPTPVNLVNPGSSTLTAPGPEGVLTAQGLVEQGRERYEAGQFQQAIQLLEEAAAKYAAEGNTIQQAIALSNLSLAYQQVGDWANAEQAITTSLELLANQPPETPAPPALLAQVLTVQGRLHYARGQFQLAYERWEDAVAQYNQVGAIAGVVEGRFNQAQALRAMGFYQRAIEVLAELKTTLDSRPDSVAKVAALRSLGDVLRAVGQFDLSTPSEELPEEPLADPIPEPTFAELDAEDLTSERVLQEALAIALRLDDPNEIAKTRLSLGNTLQAKATRLQNIQSEDNEDARTDLVAQALTEYEAAADQGTLPSVRVQALLNQFNLLVTEGGEWDGASGASPGITDPESDWNQLQRLGVQARVQLQNLPPNRTTIYQSIDLARGYAQLRQRTDPQFVVELPDWVDIADILASANRQAESLGDQRAQAYALGYLGQVYELAQQPDEAQDLTRRALRLSQLTNAADISYRWQWQLGRLLKAQSEQLKEVDPERSQELRIDAIAAYDSALESLNSIRGDLAAVPEVQFSFREDTEPIHRELVALLLEPEDTTEDDLRKAQETIEALQLAEIDNFFREACLNRSEVNIDDFDRQAAVVYPIILSDRLEVILSLPAPSEGDGAVSHAKANPAAGGVTDSPRAFRRHTVSNLSQQQVENTVTDLLSLLVSRRSVTVGAQEVYNWLIRPFEADLANSPVNQLVFVLDGALRNIPMSVLYDGEQYLVEKYSIALAPGLQLVAPELGINRNLSILMGGLSQIPDAPEVQTISTRRDFGPLPNVEVELAKIQSTVTNSQILLNPEFTSNAVQERVTADSSRVVHLATHGIFGSTQEETFILTWDGVINVNQLDTLLQASELTRRQPIELLVLSACETARGDNRAALGIAGVAVRSGARSTLATLWKVFDASTAELMARFYEEWSQEGVTKAQALRQAQLSLLESSEFSLPYYWAPFVLLGNWL